MLGRKKKLACAISILAITISLLGITVTIALGAKNDPGTIILGKSKIIVPNSAIIGVQVDRVIRDIAWENSRFDERVNLFRIPQRKQLVPYMEGRLAGILMDYAQAKIIGLTPAQAVKREDGFYYASDGRGNFRFKICPSKVQYKTAKFSSDKKEGVFVDTHGFNMIAEQAIKTKNIHTAIACMDLPSKAEAALYLAQNGINCYGPCDRFAYQLLGYKESYPGRATIIGTAPIRRLKQGAIIGNQSIAIAADELIVTQNTNKGYPDQYCDTPTRYFRELNRKYDLELKLVKAEAGAGEAQKVVKKALFLKALVIGVRVWNKDDAKAVAGWLEKDPNHRAVLFHSAPYEPGYEMFFRFPQQTSFGDLSPIIKIVN